MANNHYNYDNELHDIVINGIRLYDYAEDTKISIEYEEDFRSVTVGLGGATTTNEKHNRNALIKIKVLQTSPLNAILNSLAISAKEFTVAHIDRNFNGDVGAFASKAHFTKIPNLEIGAEAKGREWVIRAINFKPTFNIK